MHGYSYVSDHAVDNAFPALYLSGMTALQALIPEEIAASKNLGHEALRLCSEYLKEVADVGLTSVHAAGIRQRMKMLVDVWTANAETEALRLQTRAQRQAVLTFVNGLVLRVKSTQALFEIDAVRAATDDIIGGQFRRLFIRNDRLHVEHMSTEESNKPMIRVLGIVEDPDHVLKIPRL